MLNGIVNPTIHIIFNESNEVILLLNIEQNIWNMLYNTYAH